VQVFTNIDELFEREELSAAPDVGWPDCFNSGVFVFRPSNDTYASLLQFALTTGSFDGTLYTRLLRHRSLRNFLHRVRKKRNPLGRNGKSECILARPHYGWEIISTPHV